MQIYVINLLSRNDRRDNVSRQLDPLDVEYCFFQAVEGAGALAAHFSGRRDWPCRMELQRIGSFSEIACYASHLLLWKKCVELGKPIVVLEDDFQVTPDFSAALKCAEKCVDEYGFIRLESMRQQWLLNPYTQPVLVKNVDGFKLYFQTTVSILATGYALSPKYAQRLIEVSQKFTVPVDHFFRRIWIHKLPLFVLEPPAIGLSDLAEKSSIVRPKKSPLRHLIRLGFFRVFYRAWAKRATRRMNEEFAQKYPHLGFQLHQL
jgi:glycosyl transferase family 25